MAFDFGQHPAVADSILQAISQINAAKGKPFGAVQNPELHANDITAANNPPASPPAFGGAQPSMPASAAPQNSNNNLMAMLQALFGDKSQSSSNIYANQSNILPNNMAGQGQIPYGGKPLS